jgi:GMP synthase-like glutamine amidotransferase
MSARFSLKDQRSQTISTIQAWVLEEKPTVRKALTDYHSEQCRMRVNVIQHVAFEGPGAIGEWARERGHSVTSTEQFKDGRLPALDDFDFLIIMGGPMSANDDEYPWLAPEKKLIREALEAQKSILGVCLGAQLLAGVLGARVYKNQQKEIGWFPVVLTPEAGESVFAGLPETMIVLHWHGETFDLPEDAVRLASSDACVNQAFEFNKKALGLQFHLEVQPEGLQKLIENSAGDIDLGPFVQSAGAMLAAADELSQRLRPELYRILDRLASPQAD